MRLSSRRMCRAWYVREEREMGRESEREREKREREREREKRKGEMWKKKKRKIENSEDDEK